MADIFEKAKEAVENLLHKKDQEPAQSGPASGVQNASETVEKAAHDAAVATRAAQAQQQEALAASARTMAEQSQAVGQSGRTYRVRSGDSLSAIAQQFYGDANQWHRIYEANRQIISNPDLIYPDQELTIP